MPSIPTQFVPSAVGSIVHYFLTAPLRRKFLNEDPSSKQVIKSGARRCWILSRRRCSPIASAGVKLAAKIAAGDGDPAGRYQLIPTPRSTVSRGKRK